MFFQGFVTVLKLQSPLNWKPAKEQCKVLNFLVAKKISFLSIRCLFFPLLRAPNLFMNAHMHRLRMKVTEKYIFTKIQVWK